MILREEESGAASHLERDGDTLAAADAAVFTFDSSDLSSFQEAQHTMERMAHASGNTLPCLLVAVENDKGMHKVGYHHL